MSYFVDSVAAVSAAAFVSPIVGTIDKSIISHASGREHLYVGLKSGFAMLLKNPLSYFRNRFVIYVWGVYSGTFLAANYTETACKRMDIDWQLPKFISASIVNTFLSVLKDKEFTKIFALKATKTQVSPLTFSMFTIRDSLTVAASFNFPPIVSEYMQENFQVSRRLADTSAQLIIPCVVQLVSTPLHLTGLDLYNNPQHSTFQRFEFVKREYTKSVMARVGRIFPAFGIGGISNKMIKEYLSTNFS